MAIGTKSKGTSKPKSKSSTKSGRARTSVSRAGKPKPWATIIAVVAVIALAGGVFTYAFYQIHEKEKWVASADNQDPSDNIDGVKKIDYKGAQHVTSQQRVAYDQSPPFGGPHDQVWAECDGTVYPQPVRNENMVHALEHGTVWIAYNADEVKGKDLDKLKAKVQGQPYLMLSPYPKLDKPISLQSWGHQLKVDKVSDPRVDEFIKSLRENQYTTPEPGGRCDTQGTGFDASKPPPFVAAAPKKGDKNTVTMDGKNAISNANENMTGSSAPATAPPAAPPAAPSASAPPSK